MSNNCIYELEILRNRKRFVFFVTLSLIPPVVSLVDCLVPASEAFASWFQRSGSFMVVFAILAEIQANKMSDVFKSDSPVTITYSETKNKYLLQVKICKLIAVILIIIGTFIWGYGDLLAT